MTSKELSQLYYLIREIEQQKKRLEYLVAGRIHWRQHDSVQTSNGPGCTQKIERVYSFPEDSMGNPFAEEIEELREEIKHNLSKCIREQRRLERYIGSVEDSEMRQILSLRYINGLPWAQVAASISPYATEDSVKQACHRFLKKTCHQCHESV